MSVNSNFLDGSYASIIVQTTLECNMRCKHCYEAKQNYVHSRMSYETLEKLISFYLRNYKRVDFNWFGGEPLLSGIDFFKKVVELENKYNNGNAIRNFLQTNGLLCTGKYLDFLIDNHFVFSFSYDGKYNGVLREKTELVEAHMAEAKSKGYNVPVISVINNKNIRYIIDLYEDLKSRDIPFQFNAIFKMKNSSLLSPFLMSDEEYISGFKGLFEHWVYDKDAVAFSPLSKYVLNILGYSKGRICEMVGCLYKWVSVSPSGDIYNCTRFFEDRFRLVNINNVESIKDIYESPKYEDIVRETIQRRKKCKEMCELYRYCNGGANCHSYNENGSLLEEDTQMCRFIKAFFPYVINRLDQIVYNGEIGNVNSWLRCHLISSKRYESFFKKTN